jgi:hypothetical protein
MTIREKAIEAFPKTASTENTIFELASVLWPRPEAEKLRNVASWTDVLDMPVDEIGPNGIGPMLMFMEPDLAVAYLPAWLVFAAEHPYPFAGVLPSLTRVLDNDDREMNDDDRRRFDAIRDALTPAQRAVVALAINETSDVNFATKADLQAYLRRIADYWSGQAA